MEKCVIKGAKRNVENVSIGTHTNQNSHRISSEGECWIFGLPRHSLEDVQVKGNTHKLLRSSKCGKNISGENFRFITFESPFHFLINIGYICERTIFCNVAHQVTLPCTSYRLQLTIATSLCSVTPFESNVTCQLLTASGVLLIMNRIIYLFQ